jgi:putative nucleotidyltransferase with HDIG domain
MAKFLDYLAQFPTLGRRIVTRFEYLEIEQERKTEVMAFLEPLRIKDSETYMHCLRVGILASTLYEFMRLDAKAGFYAGLLHDVGKQQIRLATLQKTDGWTPADSEAMKAHVMDGYRILRDHFDFTAEVIIWHHRFQPNKYPNRIPPPLHEYSEGTRVMIPLLGRLLSLADVFDALHRVNDKHGSEPMTGEVIKQKMLKYNPDQKAFIELAYKEEIFTTRIYGDEPSEAPVAG